MHQGRYSNEPDGKKRTRPEDEANFAVFILCEDEVAVVNPKRLLDKIDDVAVDHSFVRTPSLIVLNQRLSCFPTTRKLMPSSSISLIPAWPFLNALSVRHHLYT